MDNILEWVASHIPWVLSLMIVCVLGLGLYSFSSLTRFEYEADQIVSRSGGLTKPAYQTINAIGKNKYRNMFSVRLDDKHRYRKKPADYGDDVYYKVKVNIPMFTWISKASSIKTGGYRIVQNDVRLDGSQ